MTSSIGRSAPRTVRTWGDCQPYVREHRTNPRRRSREAYQRKLSEQLHALTLPTAPGSVVERRDAVTAILRKWGRKNGDTDHHSAGVMTLGDSKQDRDIVVEVEHAVAVHSMCTRLLHGEMPRGDVAPFSGWPSADWLYEDLLDTYQTCLVTRAEHQTLATTGVPDGVAEGTFGVLGVPTHGYNWKRYRDRGIGVYSLVTDSWVISADPR